MAVWVRHCEEPKATKQSSSVVESIDHRWNRIASLRLQ